MTREELDSRLETALPGRYSPTLVLHCHSYYRVFLLTSHTKIFRVCNFFSVTIDFF